MYLFDKEDYDCTTLPTAEGWEDYAIGLRELYDAYWSCIRKYVKNNSATIPSSVLSELNSLLAELDTAYFEVKDNLTILIDTLINSPLNCFDKTTYTTYLTSYSEFKSIAKQIDILLTTGGDAIGIQPDIAVELTTIYPTDGVVKPTTTKCVGVYMKQMDNGSEFIGKVTVDNPPIEKEEDSGEISDGRIMYGWY